MTEEANQNDGLESGIRLKCFIKELCEVEKELTELHDNSFFADSDKPSLIAWRNEQILWKRKKKKKLLLLLRDDLNKLADSYTP